MTSDWKEYKFSDVATFKYGKMPQKSRTVNDGKYPIFSGYRYVGRYNEFNVEENTLIVVARGVGGTGDVKLTKEKCYLTNLSIAVENLDNTIANVKYLYYYFQLNNLRYLDSGSAQSQITITDLEKLAINLPPLETQRKIARVLGAIDDKIELNNSINKNLEQQIKSIYSNSFNNSNNLIDISDLIDIRDGTHDSPKPQKEGKKLITSKHLLKYGVDISSANLISETDYEKINERSRVETNDILISMIGTVGIVSYIIENPVDFAVKNVGIYRTSQKPEYSYYIHCYLNSTETQNYILSHLAGTTQKYISLSELRTLKVNIPNQSELENFNKLVKPMYDNIINLTKENERLTQLRDTLLPKLMNGEIDVDKVEVK